MQLLSMLRPSSLLDLRVEDLKEHLFLEAVHSLVVEEWCREELCNEVCNEVDFGGADKEVDFWEFRPRGVEVVLDLMVLAYLENVDFHRGDHEQVWQ